MARGRRFPSAKNRRRSLAPGLAGPVGGEAALQWGQHGRVAGGPGEVEGAGAGDDGFGEAAVFGEGGGEDVGGGNVVGARRGDALGEGEGVGAVAHGGVGVGGEEPGQVGGEGRVGARAEAGAIEARGGGAGPR